MAGSQNSEQVEAATARQRSGNHISTTNQYTIIEEQLQAVFSVWSAPRLYIKDQQKMLARDEVSG
jgi:hypothetical protein